MASVPASRRLASSVVVVVVAVAFAATACSAEPPASPAAATIASQAPAAPATVAPTPSPTATSTPTSTPTASPVPTPTPIVVKVPGPNEVYRFGPDLSAGTRAQVKDWVAYSVALQERLLGRRFTRFTTITSRDVRWLATEDCRTRPPGMPNCIAQQMEIYADSLMGGCYPAPSSVRCFIVGSLGVRGADGPVFGFKVMAHEAHHVFQGQLYPNGWKATMVGNDRVWSIGPVWLLEGAAEWVGWRLTIDRGLVPYDATRAEWEEWSRRIDRPLSELETRGAIDRTGNAYLLSALAVDELIGTAPAGARSLTAYYKAIGRGTAWKTAFKQAFGVSVATFYKRFEATRAALD